MANRGQSRRHRHDGCTTHAYAASGHGAAGVAPRTVRHWGLHALLGYMTVPSRRMSRVPSRTDAHTGAIAAVQRTDSALRLNVQFHVRALDGVTVRDAKDALVFHTLPAPTRSEVTDIARRSAQRSASRKILRAHARSLDPAMQDDEPPKLSSDEPDLAACYAAAARGVAAGGDRAAPHSRRRQARTRGVPRARPQRLLRMRLWDLRSRQC